jgi:hypothetical protein
MGKVTIDQVKRLANQRYSALRRRDEEIEILQARLRIAITYIEGRVEGKIDEDRDELIRLLNRERGHE